MEPKSPRVKLFAIAKDEAAYLPAWIHHHLYFGFDQIEVWLNGINDNSLQMMAAICQHTTQVRFREADELLRQCLAKGQLFQVQAYQQAFLQAKQDGFDYLMLLDLDEYFVPKNFTCSIKQLIHTTTPYDSLSLQWYFDVPDSERQPFSPDFQAVTQLCQNRHVKSLLNLHSPFTGFSIHNFQLEDGVFKLYNGESFIQLDQKDQCHRSKVSKPYFAANRGTLNDFFIFHCTFRSRQEYTASLLRGRQHVEDKTPLKVNRHGYLPEPLSHSPLAFEIETDKLQAYQKSLTDFLEQGDIYKQLMTGRDHLLSRQHKVLQLLQTDEKIKTKFSRLFRGLGLPEIEQIEQAKKRGIVAHIDHVHQQDNQLTIVGWAFAKDYQTELSFELDYQQQKHQPLKVKMKKRPDVRRIVDSKAPEACGFQCTFQIQNQANNHGSFCIKGKGQPQQKFPLKLQHQSESP